ncbi:MAG TPA: hypothetical protein VNO33_19470 [Kofleriaceae bacterium]|nr:hypothetical protein [Kofleriaceae bacterium]
MSAGGAVGPGRDRRRDRVVPSAALAWLLAACANVPASGDGGRADSGPSPDAGRPVIVKDAAAPDAGRPIADGGRPDAGFDGEPPVINEFVADHAGSDLCEFVEIVGAPATDYSAFNILVVEGDVGANPGLVDVAITVGSTDDAGIVATPALEGQMENGAMTLLVVTGYPGGTVDIDVDDDGAIDEPAPWTFLADAVAVSDGGAGDLHYAGGSLLAPSFDGVMFAVGGASRIPDGADTDAPLDWARNDFDGEGLGCGTGSPVPGEALNTPGTPNRPALGQ